MLALSVAELEDRCSTRLAAQRFGRSPFMKYNACSGVRLLPRCSVLTLVLGPSKSVKYVSRTLRWIIMYTVRRSVSFLDMSGAEIFLSSPVHPSRGGKPCMVGGGRAGSWPAP